MTDQSNQPTEKTNATQAGQAAVAKKVAAKATRAAEKTTEKTTEKTKKQAATAAEKATTKKATTKKATTKKATTKKATTNKATTKKATTKKPATKRATTTKATGKTAPTSKPGKVTDTPEPIMASAATDEPETVTDWDASADPRRLGELDHYLFGEGTHRYLHRQFGAQPADDGTRFAVWAPNATAVGVAGSFDDWHHDHELTGSDSGVWTGWVDGAGIGDQYLYRVTAADGTVTEKSDPVGAATEEPPSITSRIADLRHDWQDEEWMRGRGERIALDAPISIYEVHLGSWGRHVTDGRRFPRYDELADPIADHVLAHGFTHVEFLPIMEHPFYGSWGYQTTGFFAPSARYGTPQDLMQMIDRLHQRGVGVILDWVPSHFPTDTHGLYEFDGTHLFEHADPRQGYHPDWNSAIFNYSRNEVRSFLISSAMCWLDRYHVDALRVDAVASMLYLDYSRSEGEWIPNEFGGRENLDAIVFLRQLNEAVYGEFPDVSTMAEESTSWPMVSRPTYIGGLGFGAKWDMGWMHDTLEYLQRDPIHRAWHHGEITFRSVYSASEHFVLPLSHDEVVHGKGSLLNKMPGDDWQQFANLRVLYAMQWGQQGKKLLFMGCELATRAEWNHEGTLDWSLHDADMHRGVRTLIADLNALYVAEPALHRGDSDHGGMQWIDASDGGRSIYTWLRVDPTSAARPVVVAVNATPTPQHNVRIGVPSAGRWSELINTDAAEYGGSGLGNDGGADTVPVDAHGFHHSLVVTLPPLGALFLAADDRPDPGVS
jgi:1,4-alpha-glucan branching enzyme